MSGYLHGNEADCELMTKAELQSNSDKRPKRVESLQMCWVVIERSWRTLRGGSELQLNRLGSTDVAQHQLMQPLSLTCRGHHKREAYTSSASCSSSPLIDQVVFKGSF